MDNVTEEGIHEIIASDTFQRLAAEYTGYTKSMMGHTALAFLHALILKYRPNLVLEIGTYFAGGSEVMSNALVEAGGDTGLLLTLDSNPGREDTVRKIIAGWPTENQQRTTFMASSSEVFFASMAEKWEPSIDIAFVDGDHRYHGAYADIVLCAHHISSNGIIVVDDYDQPEVNRAVEDFVKTRPAWKFVGSEDECFANNSVFDTCPSVARTPFFVLLAPAQRGLTDRPLTFHQSGGEYTSFGGFRLNLLPHGVTGTLMANFMLEMENSQEQRIETVSETAKIHISPGDSEIIVAPDQPVETNGRHPLRCGVTLYWEAETGGEILPLAQKPEPVLA